eukprot:9426133-Pyramimonas_sp.AAC.1
MELFSDGTEVPATSYEAGLAGFIVAKWSNGASLETELPNALLKDGQIMSCLPPKAPPARRSAAKSKA